MYPQCDQATEVTTHTVRIDGQEYKIGKYGLPFVWRDGEWIKAIKDASEIKAAIKKRYFRYDHT